MRGYAGIGLHQVKNELNVGSVMRAASCYDAAFVAISGSRYKRVPTDTGRAFLHIPVYHTADLQDMIPHGCVPIAVDLVPNAIPLPEFKHPERAFYIFGPEDGTLGQKIIDYCAYSLYIPTLYCMNLAAAVNVVLYDRMAKLQNNRRILGED